MASFFFFFSFVELHLFLLVLLVSKEALIFNAYVSGLTRVPTDTSDPYTSQLTLTRQPTPTLNRHEYFTNLRFSILRYFSRIGHFGNMLESFSLFTNSEAAKNCMAILYLPLALPLWVLFNSILSNHENYEMFRNKGLLISGIAAFFTLGVAQTARNAKFCLFGMVLFSTLFWTFFAAPIINIHMKFLLDDINSPSIKTYGLILALIEFVLGIINYYLAPIKINERFCIFLRATAVNTLSSFLTFHVIKFFAINTTLSENSKRVYTGLVFVLAFGILADFVLTEKRGSIVMLTANNNRLPPYSPADGVPDGLTVNNNPLPPYSAADGVPDR